MKKIIFATVLFAAPAFAQQTSTIEQRIALQLGQLIIQNTNQGMAIEQLQAQVKDLEAKVPKEPAPVTPAKE
jgi:hypothetical protein